MTTNDEISIIANQIANKGNKPTVALINAKLRTKVPLPQIISVLKTWQHDPDFITPSKEQDIILQEEEKHPAINNDAFEQVLHQELASMKKEILELKALVLDLITQQKK